MNEWMDGLFDSHTTQHIFIYTVAGREDRHHPFPNLWVELSLSLLLGKLWGKVDPIIVKMLCWLH